MPAVEDRVAPVALQVVGVLGAAEVLRSVGQIVRIGVVYNQLRVVAELFPELRLQPVVAGGDC